MLERIIKFYYMIIYNCTSDKIQVMLGNILIYHNFDVKFVLHLYGVLFRLLVLFPTYTAVFLKFYK